jgi:hypothetical protein
MLAVLANRTYPCCKRARLVVQDRVKGFFATTP